MTTVERIAVRSALLSVGFVRDDSRDLPREYDRACDGVYTEFWSSTKDRTTIELNWDRKTDK